MSNVVISSARESHVRPHHPVLATSRFRVRDSAGAFKEIRVICDSGAQANLLSEAVLKALKVIIQSIKENIIGIDEVAVNTKGQVVLELWHRHQEHMIGVCKFVILNEFHLNQPQRTFSHAMFPSIANNELADPSYNVPGRIDGIIGVDILSRQLTDGIRRNALGLLAQATAFGWIIFGGATDNVDSLRTINVITVGELYTQIRKLWEIDECDERPVMSTEDQACEKLYQSTVVRNENRYTVSLLLRPNIELGESRSMARRRLYCLENRFNKNSELKAAYVQFMKEYENLGHMKKAEPLPLNALHYYIPHHAVAIDRKFRVVFDASAKTTNGKSLNEMQYVGPRLQKDLTDIVMNFRTGQYAITADICKMFRQIQVKPEFWDLQRILWRKSRNEAIQEYWLTVVTYGMASSPYNAVKTLHQCASDYAEEFPRAAAIAKTCFYMDDALISVDSKTAAVAVKQELIELLRKGGFELAKWRSNCDEITYEAADAKEVNEQDSTSVLGIVWKFKDDEFQFKVQDRIQPDVITKRIITSEAARIYDPQGYVTPITIRAKLYIQDLWRVRSGWDDPLPLEVQSEWKQFNEEIKLIGRIRIPRWLGTSATSAIQIHIYCDASEKAYGAAAYVRVRTGSNWSSTLLCSKSRVAPIKVVTIPRLELCAVELGCKLLPKIIDIPMFRSAALFLWTDSEIVLHWIRKPVHELKTFVANRVTRILQSFSIEQSRHVRSEDNPADLLSRGVTSEALLDNELWWNGPKALQANNEDWPQWSVNVPEPGLNECIGDEMKKAITKFDHVLLTVMDHRNKQISLIEECSSHRKACRITAYVFRFCAKLYEQCCKSKKPNSCWLKLYSNSTWKSDAVSTMIISERSYNIARVSIVEGNNALNYWIAEAQKESFSNEIKLVAKNKCVPRSSLLWTLTPCLDGVGLLRIYGRLNNTDLPDEMKRPIILHRKCILAQRLAEECHKFLCHGGVQMCMQHLRRKYWIIGIRILLRSVVRKCVICTRYRKEVSNQFMADLPAIRLQPATAFQHTGVDYAGPISLKVNRNTTTKGYIAVFVCMLYKTIHLELVSSLDASAFIAALTRFVNLRAGSVRHMYSDNGTNFVKADRELQKAVQIWQAHEVMNYLESQEIQWHFNVPSAPHTGGLWEASVKSTKHHLRRMGGAHLFTFEEFATLLAKIAACLNSRPLTPISSDPNDLLALTPGHFVMGQAVITPYEGYLADGPMNRLSAWQKIQKLQQDFWIRFSREYITEQQSRNKWARSYRSLQVGDLVFIKDEVTPPCQWLMGRIAQVFPGPDGKVRSCEVKTEKSKLVRPVTRLCLLPIDTAERSTSEIGFPSA